MLSATQKKIPSPLFELDKDPTAVMLQDDRQPGLAFFTLSQLRRRNQLCDVEIRMRDNIRLPAHKVVLASGSAYFMKLLLSQKDSEISLEELPLDITALEMLIDFIYTSVLRISQSTVKSLCQVAKFLEMERIERACCKFMVKNLSTDNCIDIFRFADENTYAQMYQQCQDYMANHITDIVQTSGFLSLTPRELAGILTVHTICSASESVLFDSLLQWFQHDPTARQLQLFKLCGCANLASTSMCGGAQLLKLPHSASVDVDTEMLKACFKALRLQLALNSYPEVESSGVTMKKEESSTVKPEENAESTEATTDKAPTTTLLFAAGGNTKYSATNSVERYDFYNGCWMPATNLPRKKSHAALVGVGQSLYSIGGFDGSKRLSSVDIYDHQIERWSEGPAMHTPKSAFGVACDSRGSIYCIGGYSNSQHIPSVEILDTKTMLWREGPPLQHARSYVQAAAIGNDIFAVGGTNSSNRLRSVEMLSDGDQWVSVADLNIPRSRPGVATLNGCLYAVGGYNGSNHLSSIECYDPKIDKWVLIEGMNIPRNSPAVSTVDGSLHIAGGHDGKKIVQSVEVYSPETGKCTTAVSMQHARCDFGMATIVVPGQQPVGTWT